MTDNNNTRPVTWKQIRAFARLLKSLSLDSRPGVDDCLQATAEPSHKGRATKVIGAWKTAPINQEPIRDAIARWFAVEEALQAIGVGAGETGIKAALDYWSRMKNRVDLSKAHRVGRFAEKAGLPDPYTAFIAELPTTQLVKQDDRLVGIAKALKAAGFSPAEVAEALSKLN